MVISTSASFSSTLASIFASIFFFLPLNAVAVADATETTAFASAQLAQNDTWTSLTPVQRRTLAPLAHDWDSLNADRKQKWIAISERFQKMSPEEQERAQEKMQNWIKLTPLQRLSARENYLRSNKLPADQRSQKWQEYQQLTDEQKAQLAKRPAKKNLITNLPTPAETKVRKLQPLKKPHTNASVVAPISSVPMQASP